MQTAPSPTLPTDNAALAEALGSVNVSDRAVGEQEGSLRQLEGRGENSKTALRLLKKLLSNVVTAPAEPKYRRLNVENPLIKQRLLDAGGGKAATAFQNPPLNGG